jgi:MFS transporter, MCT family, solute carrier family 16 (monocarboxylic acid transporters), member 10
MFASSILIYVWWTLAKDVGSAMGFVVIFGAVSGAVIGLPPSTVANIIHRSPGVDHSRLGQWTGMMYTMAAPFALTGPVIAGYLITKYKTYLTVQMWSGTCLFLASLCLLASIACARRTDDRSFRLPGALGSAMTSFWSRDEEKDHKGETGDSPMPTRNPSRTPSSGNKDSEV